MTTVLPEMLCTGANRLVNDCNAWNSIAIRLSQARTWPIAEDPIYEAEAQILVEPRSGDAVFEPDNPVAVANLDRAIQTEIRVMEGQQVRERVRQDLGLDELPPKVDASPVGSTDVVEVTVRSGDPRWPSSWPMPTSTPMSRLAVTKRCRAWRRRVNSCSRRSTSCRPRSTRWIRGAATAIADRTTGDVQGTSRPAADRLGAHDGWGFGRATRRSADRTGRTDAGSYGHARRRVGLLLGLGAAFLVDYLDDSLRSTEDIETTTGLPVLAVVPVEPPRDNRPIASVNRPSSP